MDFKVLTAFVMSFSIINQRIASELIVFLLNVNAIRKMQDRFFQISI